MSSYKTKDFPKNLSINVEVRRSFKNFKKLNIWCENERNFIEEIGDPANISHAFNSAIVFEINRRFDINRNESFTIDNLIDELKDLIETNFKTHGIIASGSKAGKWLLKQHRKNSSLTLGSYKYFQNKLKGTTVSSNLAERCGEFSAYLFDKGIEPNFEFEKEQYESFYNEIVNQKDELFKQLSDVIEDNKQLNLEINKQKNDWESNFKSQKEVVAKMFDDEHERHVSIMTKSEEFYEKKLAVKKAVTYWTKKAKSHRRNSWIFGIVAGILMITCLIVILFVGKSIVGFDLTDENGIGRKVLTETGGLQLWVYGFFIVCMTLIIWFIRLLVKVFLSNLHLLSDAKERETMIQTYLAFEREEDILKETDRDLILPSIFRVSSDSFIKEDSTPNSPINIITKRFTE